MNQQGENNDTRRAGAHPPAPLLALLAFGALLTLSGCGLTLLEPGSRSAPQPAPPPTSQVVRTALDAGDLPTADQALTSALADAPPVEPGKAYPERASLLLLRAELRLLQGLFPEAEADAAAALPLVPASTWPAEPVPAAGPDAKGDETPPPPPAPLRKEPTQRSIHQRLSRLFEDAGRDDEAELHLGAARELCLANAALVESGDCETERSALVRIRLARGRYAEAEPLVLAQISEVQARFGVYDLRLADAFCDVARFYCRQGKYSLCSPLYARSFDLWKMAREEAFLEHARAVAAAAPSPFDAEFLRPRAGHAPFAAPCGLEDQPALLYKLGKPDTAAEAIAFERKLWAGDTEAGEAALAYLNTLIARGAPPLELASARHAVAYILLKKGELARAEEELRQVVSVYDAAWPTLAVSRRRERVQDYLAALESLVELLRASRRFPEAIELGQRAVAVAERDVDAYDSLRLDTLLSVATTYREMRDPLRTEEAAGRYLEAVVAARGDTAPDYAWALRTISFAYLLRDEVDASQRMEMQAKAIWAREAIVAPGF